MFKINIWLIILTLFTWQLKAQEIKIIDASNKKPISTVVVYNSANDFNAVADENGVLDITCCTQIDTLFFKVLGYENHKKSVREIANNNFIVALNPLPFTVDEIVISASKWSQSKREIAQKVTVINQKTAALQNPQTTADLLGSSSGVFIQKSQMGGGSPMIRGFSTNRLLITIDGVRMNTAIFRSGNVQNVISIDALGTEKTEVLFGPGSVVYGSDAIGGVMSFYSLSPKFSSQGNEPQISGNAVARFSGANNEKTGHFDVNIGWKKWAALSSITYSDFDDLIMGSNGPDRFLRNQYVQRIDSADVLITNPNPKKQTPTAYSQINLMQKLKFQPNKSWDFNYAFHYSTTSDYSRYDRLTRPRGNTLRSAEWFFGPQLWWMNQIQINHRSNNKLYDQMRINLAYQFFEESRNERNLNSLERNSTREQVDAYSANIEFSKQLHPKHFLTYGTEFVFNKVDSRGKGLNISSNESFGIPSRYPDGSEWSSYAAFASYHFKINQQLNLYAGARYNHFLLKGKLDTTFFDFPQTKIDINDGAMTGSLGLVFTPTASWQISTNFSTGFRSPNVDDAGKIFDSTPGLVIVPNPNLDAEYAINIEASISKNFGKWVQADITGFYTSLENALVRRPFALNGQDSLIFSGELSAVEAIQNAARAYVYGVQTGIKINLTGGFILSSSISWQDGTEELDDKSKTPLRHSAPLFGRTALSFNKNQLSLEIYTVYNGKVSFKDLAPSEREKPWLYNQDANGNPFSSKWATLNFKAAYQVNTTFTIHGGVENLTDKRYLPYSSGLVAPGRNFILSVQVKF